MKYLPIGTVVKTSKMDKTLMIYGRKQKSSLDKEIYDYVSVLFPEGNINDKFNFFFNHEDIIEIIHNGLDNEEEQKFQKEFLNREVEE